MMPSGGVADARSTARRIFEQLDADEDGSLSPEELKFGLRAARVPISATAVARLHSDLDTDGDGSVSLEEFTAFVQRREQQLRQVYNEILQETTNADQLEIQVDNIRRALSRMEMRASAAELQKLVGIIDRDGDGKISFDEWRSFLLYLPFTNARAVFEGWWAIGFADDANGEYTLPRDTPKSDGYSQSILEKLAYGGFAGAVSRTATAPIDRLRILWQTSAGNVSEGPISLRGAVSTIVRTEGLRGLWAGNGVNVLKIVPEQAVKFTAFDSFKRSVAKNPSEVSPPERFIAGGAAGAVSQASIYPLEVIRTRMALSKPPRPSILSVARHVVETTGWRGLFAGLGPSIFGIIPYAAVDLSISSGLKEYLAKNYYDRRGLEPTPLALVACGMISSGTAMLVTFPIGLVRTKLQAGAPPGQSAPTSALEVARAVVSAEGYRGLYRGLVPSAMKVIPATAISFALWEMTSRFAAKKRQLAE